MFADDLFPGRFFSPTALGLGRGATTEGGRLAYGMSGTGGGPLVLCAPGMGDIREACRFLVRPLVDAGHRVVLLDHRG